MQIVSPDTTVSRIVVAAAIAVLAVATSLWAYVVYLNGLTVGFNEALGQRNGGRFPLFEVAIGMTLTFTGALYASRHAKLALGLGSASLLFASMAWISYIA